jgi:signal transduction histidine kinase
MPLVIWQFTPLIIPLLVGTAILWGIIITAWHKRATPGAYTVIMMCITASFYALGYTLELSSANRAAIAFWLRVEYIGVTMAPVSMLILALSYTGQLRTPSMMAHGSIAAIPLMTLIFAWTNPLHGLIWKHIGITHMDGIVVADLERGPWYWVHTTYFWLLFVFSAVLLIRSYRRSASGIYRRQIGMLLMGLLVPFAANLIYLSGVFSSHLDLNAYSIPITGIVFAWGIFSYEFLDIMPVARRAIFASMQDAVLVLDIRQRIADLNPAAQRILELDPQKAIGTPASAVLSVVPCPTDDKQTTLEIMVLGEPRTFDVRCSDLYTERNQHEGQLVVLHDITELLSAEAELQAVNKRLDTLRKVDIEIASRLDLQYVSIMALDSAMRLSLAQAGLIALAREKDLEIIYSLGYPPDASMRIPLSMGVIGRVVRTLVPELVSDVKADRDYVPVMPNARAQITIPLISQRKLVGVMNLETTEPDRFTQQTLETITLLAGRVAVAVDNSYMYQEREKLIKELDAFAHTVAHDLKNPLTVIYGYSNLLIEHHEKLPSDQSKLYLEMISETSEKMTNIINELLLLANVRKGGNVKVGPLSMADIAAEVCKRLNTMIRDYDAQITTPTEWPSAVGYAPWIEEVLVNYLSNALKYGGQPPHIELGATIQPDGMARFWVRDNGQGLTAEEQSRLFTEFSRLHQVNVEGHGLGLSIVQRIIEKLGGQVGVDSAIGQGSTFYFTLPLVKEEKNAA